MDKHNNLAVRYQLNHEDKKLIKSAKLLLFSVSRFPLLPPAKLISMAKLRHSIDHLPRVTTGLNVMVSVTCPQRTFGDIEIFHYFDIAQYENEISITSGGYFNDSSTGGDSFTSFIWRAYPGKETEYLDFRDFHSIVPDIQPFEEAVKGIDLSSGGYEIVVEDPDNPTLKELS